MILKINDRIRNRTVEHFDKYTLSLRYDAVASQFSFQGYFDPTNQDHKDLYCIGHYHIVTLEHNKELLLTGNLISETFISSPVRKLVPFGGYSLTGVLDDCQIPTSLYPLQSDGLTLKEIAEKFIKPFKIKMVIDPSVASLMDSPYEKTTAGESQTVKSYLTELAQQKNIIITHNEYGQLVFTKAKTNKKAILNYGGEGVPCPEMSLSFNGQDTHSEITVIRQAKAKGGGNAGESTVKNPYCPYVFRPKVVVQNSGDDIDTDQAAKSLLAAELKNLKLTITTDRWEIDGKILKPNNIITVLNPEVYLYKRTRWFIEQIDFTGDSTRTTAVLTCVLPEVYSGETPKYIFSGINTH